MQYQHILNNGLEFTIKITRSAHYCFLSISDGEKTIYENQWLPLCKNMSLKDAVIESEENASRIAEQWLKYYYGD